MKPTSFNYAEYAELKAKADKQNAYCEALKAELNLSRECFESLSGQYENSCASGIADRKTIEQTKAIIEQYENEVVPMANAIIEALNSENIALRAERDALKKQLAEPIKKAEVE